MPTTQTSRARRTADTPTPPHSVEQLDIALPPNFKAFASIELRQSTDGWQASPFLQVADRKYSFPLAESKLQPTREHAIGYAVNSLLSELDAWHNLHSIRRALPVKNAIIAWWQDKYQLDTVTGAVEQRHEAKPAADPEKSLTFDQWRGRLQTMLNRSVETEQALEMFHGGMSIGEAGIALNNPHSQEAKTAAALSRAANGEPPATADEIQAAEAKVTTKGAKKTKGKSVGDAPSGAVGRLTKGPQRKPVAPAVPAAGELRSIDLASIDPNPHNPRQEFPEEEIDQLAESIAASGLLQPIVVREIAGRYQVIAGERRLRACRQLGRTTIEATVVTLDDKAAALACVDENLARADLNPIENARAMRLLSEQGFTQQEIAGKFGLGNQSQVANALATLKLPEEYQERIADGTLSPSHARHVAGWRDRPQVLSKALQLFDAFAKNSGRPMGEDRFSQAVDEAAMKCSKPLKQSGHGELCPFRVTPKLREQLDCQEVRNPYGSREARAFNITEWYRLAKAAKQDAAKKEAGEEPTKNTKAGKPAGPPRPGEWKTRDQLKRWFGGAVAAKVKSVKLKPTVAVSLLMLLYGDDRRAYELLLQEWNINENTVGSERAYTAKLLTTDLVTRAKTLVATLLTPSPKKKGSPDYVDLAVGEWLAVAELFGVDYAAEWRPSVEVFDLYHETHRRQFAKQHGLSGHDPKTLAAEWPAGEFPKEFAPETVAEMRW